MTVSQLARMVAGSVMVAGLVALTPTGAHAVATKVKTTLTGTTSAPGASGRGKLVLKTASNGKFALIAHHLPASRSFDVVMRGRKIGTMATNFAGTGRLNLSTQPRPTQSLLGFDPRGAQIVVRDATTGDDDLTGDVPDNSDSSEGACCFQNQGEEGDNGCDDLIPTDCAAAHGTPAGTPSCIPNPCGTTGSPGGSMVFCCTGGSEDDEQMEPECNETDQTDCAEKGGTVVSATSCDPNPCATTPPAQTIICCVPDGGDTECEELTSAACTARGGQPNAATSCDSDPCGGSNDGGGGGGD